MDIIKTLAASELAAHIESVDNAVIFYHKNLCPHCKNLEKVLNKFSKKSGYSEIYSVNSEEEPCRMGDYGVERVPSLMFIKNGQVIHVKTGLLNPKELLALHNSLLGEEGV